VSSDADAPVTYRPLGARVVAAVAGLSLTTIMLVLWVAMPDDVRATFSWLQTMTLLLFWAAVVAVLHGIGRTRVRSDSAGISVLNGYRWHYLTWPQVLGISLPRGAPWAVIDTSDGSVVPVMALQAADGDRARRAVGDLRRRINAHSGRAPER